MADRDDEVHPPGLEGFLRHNRRQRRAIRAYIREVTGLELEQVPQAAQDRLALRWVRRYGVQFRDEDEP